MIITLSQFHYEVLKKKLKKKLEKKKKKLGGGGAHSNRIGEWI